MGSGDTRRPAGTGQGPRYPELVSEPGSGFVVCTKSLESHVEVALPLFIDHPPRLVLEHTHVLPQNHSGYRDLSRELGGGPNTTSFRVVTTNPVTFPDLLGGRHKHERSCVPAGSVLLELPGCPCPKLGLSPALPEAVFLQGSPLKPSRIHL